MIHLCLLALMLALANHQIISGVDGSGWFTFVNNCADTIWPGISADAGSGPLSTTGFVLQQGSSKTIQVPSSWVGQLWARTQCFQDSTGKFTCLTGDCGSGEIECNGGRGNGSVAVTLVEFKFGDLGGMDFYDVSLVDGYNLPLLVVSRPQASSGTNCLRLGCAMDLNNGACPSQLELKSAQGDVVACKSPCTVFNTDEYCCRGAYSNQNTCKPTNLSMVFKKACPRAYSYAFDDATFHCSGALHPTYIITFCPSPATSPVPSPSPSPSPGSPSPGGDGDHNSYYLPFVNGSMEYNGAMDVNSSGATTCINVLRSQLIAGAVAVAVAVATTVWRLCQHF